MAPGAHVIISDPYQFVFVGVPKAATQSLFPWLVEHYAGRQIAMHSRTLPAGTEGYRVWSVVRNPYARAVSMWWSVTGQGPTSETYCVRPVTEGYGDAGLESFLHWVLDLTYEGDSYEGVEELPPWWLGPQTSWLAEAKPSVTLRLESFGPDTMRIIVGDQKPDKPLAPLPRNNDRQGEHGPWQRYMTREAVWLVNLWAEKDFEAFGYTRLMAKTKEAADV